ncbi:MAG: copper resistance protein CopC [Gemmatimonadetes bacterium]|nr:copper resistance protein CopC [Gemmatimonadota bacterium]
MLVNFVRTRLIATLGVVAGAGILGAATTTLYHADLKNAWPAKNDSLAKAPDSLKLWYSEKVELPLTKIALTSAGKAQALSAPAYLGEAKDAPIVLAVKDKLAPGTYTVDWTVAGKDGHASKGKYDFVVKAAK